MILEINKDDILDDALIESMAKIAYDNPDQEILIRSTMGSILFNNMLKAYNGSLLELRGEVPCITPDMFSHKISDGLADGSDVICDRCKNHDADFKGTNGCVSEEKWPGFPWHLKGSCPGFAEKEGM